MPDSSPGLEQDFRIFLRFGQVIEVDDQLEVRIVHRLHPGERLGHGVDDVRLLHTLRLDPEDDAFLAGERRDGLREGDELFERLLFRKAVGHAPGGAAAEDDQFHAQPVRASEGLADVGQGDAFVDVGAHDAHLVGEEHVRGGGLDRGRVAPLHEVREFLLAELREVPHSQLDIVEARGPGALDVLRAVSDRDWRGGINRLRTGLERGQQGESGERQAHAKVPFPIPKGVCFNDLGRSRGTSRRPRIRRAWRLSARVRRGRPWPRSNDPAWR